jgi:hypothetical protein
MGEPVSKIYEEREKLKLEREDERKNPLMVLGPMTAGELQARKELGEARAEMYRLRDERDGWMERHEKAMECNRQLSALIDEERAATQAEIRLLRTRARCRRLFGSTITAGPHAGEGAKRCTLEHGHVGPCGAFP